MSICLGCRRESNSGTWIGTNFYCPLCMRIEQSVAVAMPNPDPRARLRELAVRRKKYWQDQDWIGVEDLDLQIIAEVVRLHERGEL